MFDILSFHLAPTWSILTVSLIAALSFTRQYQRIPSFVILLLFYLHRHINPSFHSFPVTNWCHNFMWS